MPPPLFLYSSTDVSRVGVEVWLPLVQYSGRDVSGVGVEVCPPRPV